MSEVSLNKDFVRQMEYLLGDEARSLMLALTTKPPFRGVRLHRWTALQTRSLPSDMLLRRSETPSEGSSTNPYAISTLFLAPPEVLSRVGKPVPWMTDGFYIPVDSTLGKTVYHEAGAFYIQEPSAMAVATALAVKPGERVLDLCAAPGGKTTALARALRGQGLLVANEIHPKRVLTLAQNIERLGIPATIVNESPERLAASWGGYFDAVLVDAPCSGEGMFRKDETAREEWTPEAPEVCAQRQREILRAAVQLVKPGGRLVYSTCTLNPVENEQVVAYALSHLPVMLEALPDWPGWSAGRPDFADDTPELAHTRRLWPHIGEGEGHFVALLKVVGTADPSLLDSELQTRENASGSTGTSMQIEKRARFGDHKSRKPKAGHERKKTSDTEEWVSLANELFTDIPPSWRDTVQRGDLLFAAPPRDLNLEGLKVLRPGLCLTERVGKRLQPHHSLAMAVHPELVRDKLELDLRTAVDYFAGLSLEEKTASGWCLMYTSGMAPLGWGKGVPGRINNAYPKGLRRQGLLS